MPMMCEEEWTSPSDSLGCPHSWSVVSSGMVLSIRSKRMTRPPASVTVFASKSIPSTLCSGPNLNRSLGRSFATPFHMAPVPPWRGYLNTAFGPQLPSSFPWRTFEIARPTSTVATRSPSHLHCISVVGVAHTLKLYGRMNTSAKPSPCVRRIHSSNVDGGDLAVALRTLASTKPSRHFTWSATSKALMLFWNGYATHRPLKRTYEMRWCVFQLSGPAPRAASNNSSKYL
mmetsp:Transcript_28488/g.93073  ORF Transcript_28488/g.93073 Transcript_28488/m.93073 type:complete len:230 (-) Transcript_28488:224-913(-)